ncbi:MAG: hypothetical protein PG981_000802 [Wolbachia endosymbiont of Ctenocephalides orientis wCori]|nr:MAG: hypothetical protein PG981_000802 [Wolbachia endosymbiont of Ctenocephalides orientis wCori]
MPGIIEKYNESTDSTYFKNLKAGGRFAIYYLGATFALGILGLITGSPILIFPLAMLISHPLIWVAMGIVLTVVYKTIAKPLFYSAKDFINKKRGFKEEGVGEQKSQEPEKKSELKRSVSANSIFTQKESTISTQDTTLRRKVSLDSSGYASSEGGASNRGTPIKKGRRSSSDSDYSSGSDVSINSTAGKQLMVKSFPTVGDGNCFFHAIFGKKDYTYRPDMYEDGVYRAEKAQQMREEWHKFLSQFTSLDDQRMLEPLREQMQKVFNMFLSKPEDLTGRSGDIKKLAEKVKDRIKEADTKTEELKKEIVKKFQCNSGFRSAIYLVIKEIIEQRNSRNPNDQKLIPSIQELLDDKEKLYNKIQEDLESCTLVLNSNLSNEEYSNTYDPKVIKDTFLNDPELYRCYLEAIQNPNYYIFIEEIPILASLANIEIDVHYRNNNNNVHTPFEPNPEMISGYQSNFLWGKKEPKTIHLEGAHYERAEVVEVETQIIEEVSSSMYNIAASVWNSIANLAGLKN